MKYSNIKILLIILLFLSISPPSTVAKLNRGEFVSDGAAKVTGGEPLQAKYAALAIAKENAIIQAVCTFTAPRSIADNYATLQRAVLANPQRYITSFNIIFEKQEGDLTFVKIFAKINLTRLESKVSTLRVDKRRPTPVSKIKPKIMVVIPEIHIRRRVPDPAAETEIISKLIDAKFRVVDQTQVAKIRYNDKVKQAFRGDATAAIAIGLEYGADIVIVGEAFSEFGKNVAGGLVSCNARVEARAVKMDTGEIIEAKGFHANGLDRSEILAGKKALTNGGAEIAKYFIKRFSNVQTDAVITQVVVSGINFMQLKVLTESLENASQVSTVRKETFSQGIAKLEVRCRGSADELSNLLSNLKFQDFKLEVTGLSGNRIEVEIQE